MSFIRRLFAPGSSSNCGLPRSSALNVNAVNGADDDRADPRVCVTDNLRGRVAIVNHEQPLADASLDVAVIAEKEDAPNLAQKDCCHWIFDTEPERADYR
jgi:hypothetical protein